MQSKRTPASVIALGGVLAALAVVIMNLGGLIPVATYVCPVLCALLLQVVLMLCGSRIAWAWYGAVSILSLLLSPDKEAALVFGFLGYYPIVKPWMDRRRLSVLWKGLLFNGTTLLMYWLMMRILGMEAIIKEFQGLGIAMTAILLILGNMTFFMMDRVLNKIIFKIREKRGH